MKVCGIIIILLVLIANVCFWVHMIVEIIRILRANPQKEDLAISGIKSCIVIISINAIIGIALISLII